MKFEEKQPEPVRPNVVIELTREEAERLHLFLPNYSNASRNASPLHELYKGLDAVLYPIPF